MTVTLLDDHGALPTIFVPTTVQSAVMSVVAVLGSRTEQYLTIHLVTGGAHRMFNPLMLLAAEASGVIALRMMKLMLGGRSARREANLMVREKIKVTIESTASLAAGASGDEIVHRYRQHVAKNAKRLLGRSLKSTRRRRK
jgi:hypothetical protein